jgi:DNA-binding transcriptional regulator YbjK
MLGFVESGSGRRRVLLEAALRLIGDGGLHALSHRAVEAEAGVPPGSAVYYFRTRDQLVAAVVHYLVDLDRTTGERLAHDVAMALARHDGQASTDQLLADVAEWFDRGRGTQLARYELELAGARDPRLRESMSEGAASFWRLFEPLVAAAGSQDAEHDARMVVAMLDGLLMDRFTHDPPDASLIADGLRRILASFTTSQVHQPVTTANRPNRLPLSHQTPNRPADRDTVTEAENPEPGSGSRPPKRRRHPLSQLPDLPPGVDPED